MDKIHKGKRVRMKKEENIRSVGRSSNFELLRIVSILMIIVYHIVYHCVGVQLKGGDSVIKISNTLFNHPFFYKKLFLIDGIMTFGPIANAVFLMISGYFMVVKNKKINLTQIAMKLLLQLGFAAVALVIASALLFRYDGENSFYSLFSINSFNSMSWYVGYYFLIILMGVLFLNKYLLGCGSQKYSVFLIVIFAITQFGWTGSLLEGIGSGLRTSAIGLFLYSLGGYIRIYEPFKRIRTFVFLLIPVAVGILIFISSFNITQTNIENFYLKDPNGTYVQSYMSYGNYSIIVILIGICMFEIFKRIKIPQNKVINFLGKATFMTYLIHDNSFFYSIWGLKDWIFDLYYTPCLFLLNLTKWGVATFAVGIMVYVAYLGIGKLLHSLNWVFVKKEM